MPLTFFLTFRMVFVSCRLETLTLSLFGSVLGNQWQPLMLEEPISTFSFLNNLRAMSSSSECSNYSQRPLDSRYSRLEYFSTVVPTKQFVFWVFSFFHNFFNIYFLIFAKVESNLFWYSRAKAITVSLVCFFSADSDSDIVI